MLRAALQIICIMRVYIEPPHLPVPDSGVGREGMNKFQDNGLLARSSVYILRARVAHVTTDPSSVVCRVLLRHKMTTDKKSLELRKHLRMPICQLSCAIPIGHSRDDSKQKPKLLTLFCKSSTYFELFLHFGM